MVLKYGKLMKDTDNVKVTAIPEIEARKRFMLIVENFLGNHQVPNYEGIVQNWQTGAIFRSKFEYPIKLYS